MGEILCINGNFGPWKDMEGNIDPTINGELPKEGEIYTPLGKYKMKDGVWCYHLAEFQGDYFECENFVDLTSLKTDIELSLRAPIKELKTI